MAKKRKYPVQIQVYLKVESASNNKSKQLQECKCYPFQ